jgi:hypothetical protein
MHDGLSVVSAGRSRHAVYGLVVDSDFTLDALPTLGRGDVAADVRILLAPPGYFASYDPRPHPEMWYRYERLVDGRIHLGIPGVLQAEIAGDGRSALCAPVADGDTRAFAANVLNFVLTIALTLQGEEPLHATAVRLGKRAIGLLGESGSGKSTLAAFLLAQGAALVTDDLLRLGFDSGEATAFRGPSRLKLFEEQARLLLPSAARDAAFNPMSGKLLVEADSPAIDEHLPLAALFWLGEPAPSEDDAAVAVRRMQGGEAMQILLSCTLHRDHRPVERLERQLRVIQRIAQVVPLFALGYARRHDQLPCVAAAVRQWA